MINCREKNSCQVSIIIVNYNTTQLLKNCIQSVQRLTADLCYEIIVVDNASQENPAELLQEEFPEVRFITSSVNLGFGRANNLGAQSAKGEYLFFLNSDTVLLNNAILILYSFMKSHPEAGICGGNLYNDRLNPVHSYYRLPVIRDEWKSFFSLNTDISQMHNFGENEKCVGYICGADLMISKQLFDIIGGFDKDFFLYYEETELTYRSQKYGYITYSVPQAKIIHYHGMSTTKKKDELKSWALQEGLYSKFLYYKKTGKLKYPLYIKRIYMLKSFLALGIYKLTNKQGKIIYWRTKREMVHNAYRRYKVFLDSKN